MTESERSRPTHEVRVNGETMELPCGLTVSELLARLGVDTRSVAVECNKKLVLKVDYATTRLEKGDQVEIVSFVGGG